MKRFFHGCLALFLVLTTFPLQAQSPPPIRIMPLGDSITHGAGGTSNRGGYRGPLYDLLTAAGYNVDFVGTQTGNSSLIPDQNHQGHSGWRIDQLLSNMDQWLGSIADPDVVLMHIGTNDFGQNYQTATAIDRLESLIVKIATARPHAHIIVTNLMERVGTANDNIISQFNPFVEGIVTEQAALGRKVTFLDMRSAVPLSDMPDNLHPNQTGYDKMAAAWNTAIQAVITPYGDNSIPVVVRARGLDRIGSVEITFSKPMADNAGILGNYGLGGIIPQISLSADKRVATIINGFSNPNEEPPSSFTLTLNNITDRMPVPNALAADTLVTYFPATERGYLNHVEESKEYTLVHSLDIPNVANYSSTAYPAYTVDNRKYVGGFNRIAYYLELQKLDGDIEYVWASMDAFTTDINKVGVPVKATDAVFEQVVQNLHVVSNVAGVQNTTTAAIDGMVEFWPTNYSAGANNGVGGNGSQYDFDDSQSSTGTYGSMQVHNVADQKTVFAFNNWGGTGTSSNIDIGIGNSSTPVNGGVDWTFANNGGSYVVKTLQVLVQSSDDATAPILQEAIASAGGNRIYVKFSEPVAAASVQAAQFTLSNGVEVLAAELAENQREVILITTSQPEDTPLTLTVSGIRDTSPSANLITPDSSIVVQPSQLPADVLTNVGPAAEGYELVYSVELPEKGNFNALGSNLYHWNDSAATSAFTRIAYYLELQKPGQASQYTWVSMDAFTVDRRKIGIPTTASGAVHQRIVTNMDVVSNVAGISTGTGISTGNIEFWPNDYTTANGDAIPNASATTYDFGDTRSSGGSFGSMQIHNHGASQTLMAINHWGADGNTLDVGMGNNPSPANGNGVDWTNAANAGQFARRILHVMVLPGTPATAAVPIDVAANIPEAEGYQLVYSLDIPNQGNLTSPAYSIDNSSQVGPFKRIAYYLELQTGSNAPEYIWTSMDAFTHDATRIGVPTSASGAIHHRILNRLNVVSNKAGIVTGTDIATGNIEFWPTDYDAINAAGIPGASATLYDFGDNRKTTGSHGSMQIHNHGSGQTLFAISNWGNASSTTNKFGMGIGNGTGSNPDWTFASNSANYSSRKLHVLVLPGDPDNIGPVPLRAVGSTQLNRLVITFDEPLADSSAKVENFSINGLTVTGATLLSNKKEVAVFTSEQTAGSSYTINITGVRDRSSRGNLVAPDASVSFTGYEQPDILSNYTPDGVNDSGSGVIDLSPKYHLIYHLEIPSARPQWNLKDIPYSVDESKYGEMDFRKVAYLMELDDQYVFVAFDAHTQKLTRIGVPTLNVTSTPFQQKVTNMTVETNVPGITPIPWDQPSNEGNIEFWGGNYSAANAISIPNASATAFDWGDTMSSGAHACMQVHNHGAGQTLFAYNNWGSNSGGFSDLGLGTQTTGEPDWTFAGNANSYTTRNLYVLVQRSFIQPYPEPAEELKPKIVTHPVSKSVAFGGSVTLSVTATGTSPLRYQWMHDGTPVPGAILPWLEINQATPNDEGYYYVIVTNGDLISTQSFTATLQVSNTPPVFAGYKISTAKNTNLSISREAVAAKATDAEFDPVTAQLAGLASTMGGTVNLDPTYPFPIVYTPPTDFLGADSIPITLSDGRGGQTSGAITVQVVGQLPAAGASSAISMRSDGKIDGIFKVSEGVTYNLERSTTLKPDEWTVIDTLVAGDDGLVPVHDANPPEDRAFYRLVPVAISSP